MTTEGQQFETDGNLNVRYFDQEALERRYTISFNITTEESIDDRTLSQTGVVFSNAHKHFNNEVSFDELPTFDSMMLLFEAYLKDTGLYRRSHG